ncbi:D-glycero-alpha-D-manno-heptose-1,7-bisphosphate 7-phosphatase [Gracilibacillus sp. HCP3S3_G5_1]|uniref:D-glycero-alpha-D-manno-heptose-1,7-bisphosphate 7-phosphatase n=1 Tax=unclassified Gracilibacillus TaxID=2625209 RepID=UPI003F88ED27
MKVAFFDRDGTIIEDYPDQQWSTIRKPKFINGAIPAMKEVIRKEYKIIIVTNQYIINEGYITLEQYHLINDQMIKKLKDHNIEILEVFYCPHGRNEGCSCIKPKDGMIKQALEKYQNINLTESFMIGDSAVDIELAIRLGMKGFGIGSGLEYKKDNIISLKNISELVEYI